MKGWLKNFKIIARRVDFFWQAVVVFFLLALIVILVACVVWGLGIERSLNSPSSGEGGVVEEKLTTDTITKISNEIKMRANKVVEITNNLPVISDPSR